MDTVMLATLGKSFWQHMRVATTSRHQGLQVAKRITKLIIKRNFVKNLDKNQH